VLTLLLAPHGQQVLFKLTPTTLSLSLLGHLIYGISIGMLLPYVSQEQAAGAEPGQKAIAAFQDVWEEPIDEEATVKLPPMLRARPIWEQKTTPLPVAGWSTGLCSYSGLLAHLAQTGLAVAFCLAGHFAWPSSLPFFSVDLSSYDDFYSL